MLPPPMAALVRVGLAQASYSGSGSLMTVPGPWATAGPDGAGQPVQGVPFLVGSALLGSKSAPQVAPNVLPAMTSKAPGVEGPKPVLKELSLIEKRWA